MLAEMLDASFMFYSLLDLEGAKARPSAKPAAASVEATLPVVVVQPKRSEQRIPNMRGIMAARTDPLNDRDWRRRDEAQALTRLSFRRRRRIRNDFRRSPGRTRASRKAKTLYPPT